MLRSAELSSGMGPSSLRRFCQDCIIATRGYNFRERQVAHCLFGCRQIGDELGRARLTNEPSTCGSVIPVGPAGAVPERLVVRENALEISMRIRPDGIFGNHSGTAKKLIRVKAGLKNSVLILFCDQGQKPGEPGDPPTMPPASVGCDVKGRRSIERIGGMTGASNLRRSFRETKPNLDWLGNDTRARGGD